MIARHLGSSFHSVISACCLVATPSAAALHRAAPPRRNAPIKSLTAAIGWQIYALTGSAYSLGLAGLDHRADGDGRHTISGIVRVTLVRLGEFESGMTTALLGAMPAVVLDGVGTSDVGRSLS
ncbi:hypothetical protein M2175_003070 [Bradyrhizobium elkanii]|uniref:hypothetical protein n=1 Tax=Bradyrhizobium TaxID=374 RepID=UPI00216A26AE|nr:MULTISPECIES: hypothetical protein [Bradyrhizobium]MCS3928039.1 hypothetical protein [Bradyrhizobium elkanii]MCS3968592.1 hypothetical protein [Bradyrhizobium japonicum]